MGAPQLAQRTLASPKLQAAPATKVAAAAAQPAAESHPAHASHEAPGHGMREHAREKLYNDDESALKAMKKQIGHLRKQATHKSHRRAWNKLEKYAEAHKEEKKPLEEEEETHQ